MIISGTISNTVKLQMQNSKWQAKKDSGNVLSKEERNERANWTQADWLKNDFQEQLAQNKEASKNTDIRNKIMYGGVLTPEEEKYLEQNDPSMLQKYKQVRQEKKAYEEKLKKCKTKDEVQKLKTETLGGYLSSLKKVENNPNIPLSEKLAQAQETLAKTRSIQKVEIKFMQSAAYANLPTEAEEEKERSDETKVENEQALVEVKESVEETGDDKTTEDETQVGEIIIDGSDSKLHTEEENDSSKLTNDTGNDIDAGNDTGIDSGDPETDKLLQDIESTYNRILLNTQSSEGTKSKGKVSSDDNNRKQIDVVV